MTELLHNALFLSLAAGVLIVLGTTLSGCWVRVRKATLEAHLKRDMSERGMATDEIGRVIEARSGRSKDVVACPPPGAEDRAVPLVLPRLLAARVEFDHAMIGVAGRQDVAIIHFGGRGHVRGAPLFDHLPVRRVLRHFLIWARLADQD